jgi:hypothetical protein
VQTKSAMSLDWSEKVWTGAGKPGASDLGVRPGCNLRHSFPPCKDRDGEPLSASACLEIEGDTSLRRWILSLPYLMILGNRGGKRCDLDHLCCMGGHVEFLFVGAARRSGFVMDGAPTLGNLWHTGIQSFRAARSTLTPASKLAGDPDTPACGSKAAPVGAALYAETEVSAYLEAGLRQSGSVLRTRRFS